MENRKKFDKTKFVQYEVHLKIELKRKMKLKTQEVSTDVVIGRDHFTLPMCRTGTSQ